MKKLMVAAVAVTLAICANAASVKWSTGYEVANGTDTGVTSATVAYFIDSSVLSQTAVYEAVMAGSTLDAVVGSVATKSASMTDGKITAQTFSAFTAGDTVAAYMVVFDSDMNALYFSEELSKKMPNTASATYKFNNDSSIEAAMADMSTFNASVGGWVSTAAVPEPTSGLLMLLGMAGLALRRRRA